MEKIIKNVLNTLEKAGYEAYIVGGFVRDLFLNNHSSDVDICTNALPATLNILFPNSRINLGGIAFKKNEYFFEITTYRKEIEYENRKPIKYNYINNLEEDLLRRDFTINTICMNKNGNIIDLMDGLKDLKNKEIKMIGNIKEKIKEDPLRIMRAIRLATILDFKLDSILSQEIKKNSNLVLNLSSTRIRLELDKILLSPNVKKGFKLMEDLNILKQLKITYSSLVAVSQSDAMYAQINIDYPLVFTNVEKNNIQKIKKILKEGEINKRTIYDNGLYLCLLSGQILSIKAKNIYKLAKSLPIKEIKDIDISAQEIVSLLNIDYDATIKVIYKELENLILEDKIKNKKSIIKQYLLNNKVRWVK